MIDFNSPVLGQQYASLEDFANYKSEIAPCRTFVFLHEVEKLLSLNLTVNVQFAKKLKKLYKAQRKLRGKPKYDVDAPPIYDLEGIRAVLPHRYPFLLVDKIIELSDTHVVGVKSVTFNEHFFQGHFPGNPVMPGVLQLEAMAQTGGMLVVSTLSDPENWDTYFLKISEAKFKNVVVPGDSLILKLELVSPVRRGLIHMQGTAYVGNKIVSEAEMIAQIVKRTK